MFSGSCCHTLTVGSLGCLLLAGCSGWQERVRPPEVDPAASAGRAIAEYDADGDGALSEAELARCPGILQALDRFDKDGDGQVSDDELAAQFRKWIDDGIGILSFSCRLRLGGRPLAGATVKLVPEAFLGGSVKPASGISGRGGVVSLSVGQDELPPGLEGLRGVQCGVYKIQITHPTKSIPAKFNTDTTLGVEVSVGGVGRAMNIDL